MFFFFFFISHDPDSGTRLRKFYWGGGGPKPISLLKSLSKCLIKPTFAYYTEPGVFKTLAALLASSFIKKTLEGKHVLSLGKI